MTEPEDCIQALAKYMTRSRPVDPRPVTVELDENGVVVMLRDGNPFVWINAEDYRALAVERGWPLPDGLEPKP